MSRRASNALLLAGCVIALFWNLGSHGLTEPDEGRTAGIGLDFFRTGTWLVPRLYDLAQFNKPPLVYWACSLAYSVCGVNEWAARLPAALAALGTLLLTFSIARRLYGEREAIAATLVLLTAPMFFTMAHIIDPNMMLTFWITLSMWAAIAWFQDGKKFHQWIFYLALGVAFLAKGPPAFGVIGLALLGHRYLPGRDGKLWRNILNVPALLIAIAIALSWFVAVSMKHPELWKLFLGRELVGRFASDLHGRSQPPWFFLPLLPGGFLPWLPLFFVAMFAAVKSFKTDARIRLLLIWVVLPFVMFSLSKSKLPAYILPLFPPCAILMGAEAVRQSQARWFRMLQIPYAIIAPVVACAAFALFGTHEFGWDSSFAPGDAILLLPLAGAAIAAAFLKPANKIIAASAVAVLGYIGCLQLVARHDHQLEAHSSTRRLAGSLKPMLQDGDRVVILKCAPRGLDFYLNWPLSFSDKFEVQIQSDRQRLAGRIYKDGEVAIPYGWFDTEPRVFVITTDRIRGSGSESPLDYLTKACRKKPREVYRDGKYVVVANF